MDQSTRNTLRNVVTQCRKLLEESVAQVLQGQFGIYAAGKKDEVQIEPEARMSHLSEEDRAYRQDLLDHYEHIKALGYKAKDALAQLIREVAFTHLNRFCAYRMMESRGLIRESVSKGLKSQGFLFYLADHEEDERRFNTGQQDVAYRHFLNWLGGTLSEEIGVLFAPTDPANRLYPPQRVIDQVLGLLNDPELAGIWSEDEAIGWVYQYFTPKELRDQARKESQAPRNSYELAFRNQFFTPRYVVEFLTDNTLGRIWYEMRQGNTRLKDQCRYMVRRPTEVFLKDGEAEPKDAAKATDDLSQEELLKLPVYVPFRANKDPRELRILDPACGSGHFLLYCFDLLLTIYEEAYGDPDLGPALKKDYPTLEDLRRDVPRLILAHNLHGIDIDPRASQIAALALWLRCQRAYQDMGIKQDRPKITRSNIVCAEPMPGEERMLKEFVDQLEPKILGQLVEVVFDKMKLAGEAGSLLRVEEDIRDAVALAKKQYAKETTHATDRKGRPLLFTEAEMGRVARTPQPQSLFDLSDISDGAFFEKAEARVIDVLRSYSENAHAGARLSRRLFAEDTVRGFAFVELCRKRYDVLLMNPPFGLGLKHNFDWLKRTYPDGYVDLLSAFVSRASGMCVGYIGAITSRSVLVTKKLERLRSSYLLPRLTCLLDLGWAVMDGATVQSCAFVTASSPQSERRFIAADRLHASDKSQPIDFNGGDRVYTPDRASLALLPRATALYAAPSRIAKLLQSASRLRTVVLEAKHGMNTFNNFRFLRLRWEVSPECIGPNKEWEPLSKGGPYAVYYADLPLLVRWSRTGDDIAEENKRANGQTAQARQASTYYRLAGATYSRRSSKDFGVRVLPSDCIIGEKGPAVLPTGDYSKEYIIGLLNSRMMNSLVHLQANAKQYDSGIIERLPWSEPTADHREAVEELTTLCIRAARTAATRTDETDANFTGLQISSGLADTTALLLTEATTSQEQIEAWQHTLNEVVDKIYRIESHSLRELVLGTNDEGDDDKPSLTEEDDDCANLLVSADTVTRLVLSLAVGLGMGRWKPGVFHSDAVAPPKDLFHSLPALPPIAALNTAPATQPSGDGLTTHTQGIFVDDLGHPSDLLSHIRTVLEQVWPNQSEVAESEACQKLGVAALRDYFRKPGKGGFWDDHISRYSKSRRKAPIYWLLQSSKKNYAIWLYYHCLDKDILFKALVNYVEPKIRLENDRLDSLRAQKGEGGNGKATKKLDKEIEKQEDFLSELRDFEEKLRRAAELRLVPDLNDGVVLNIAPLHELVPWKEAEKYWEELLEGKYEWSSIGKQLREKGLVK